LAMAYNCSVSQEKLLQYIHHNRHSNTLLVQHNTKLINKLRTDNSALVQENTRKIEKLRTENTLLIQENNNKIDKLKTDNNLLIQENTNAIDNLKEESTLLIQENTNKIDQLKTDSTLLVQHNTKQIDKLRIQNQNNNKQIDQLRTEVDSIKAETSPLRQLIAENSHLIDMLRSLMPVVMLVRKQCDNPMDYFDKTFAEYQEGFSANGEVWIGLDKLHQLTSAGSYSLEITMTDYDGSKRQAVYEQFEVGPWDGYILTLGKFNAARSTLGDSLLTYNNNINGMKFSTKDRDQDVWKGHCAKAWTGGWWYKHCADAHPTGLSSATKIIDGKYVYYWHGGERGSGFDSWSEAEYLLVPN